MEQFQTLKDHVYDYISEKINSGALKAGDRINESIVCNDLNISRTPVREALIQLSAEDLLDNLPRRGFVVKALDTDAAAETYDIIGVLDGYAARLACDKLDDKAIADMELYVKYMDMAIDSGNYDMYYKCQEEYHMKYMEKCGNKRLVDIIVNLKKKFLHKQYIVPAGSDIKEILHTTNKEHEEIIRLLKAGDAAGAEAYLRDVHWNQDIAFMETV